MTTKQLIAAWRGRADQLDEIAGGDGETSMTFRRCATELEVLEKFSPETEPQPLAQEIATYERLKPHLLALYEGKYALIKEQSFIGAFDDWPTALKEGYEAFGPYGGFLIRKIQEKETVQTA
jgi:hypothetical protein